MGVLFNLKKCRLISCATMVLIGSISSTVMGESRSVFDSLTEVEELQALLSAEQLLKEGNPADAAMVITPLSLEGHHGPAILQIRTWALYHSDAFLELTLLLEEAPQIAGELRFLRGVSRLRSGDLEGGKSDLQFLWWNEPDTIWGLAALREIAISNLPGTYNAMERKLIKKINDSLADLDKGDYGYCEDCGVEIGIKRLEARPTANLCIACKSLTEIREKQNA